MGPVEISFINLVSGGEGHHNYHHVFPWDYKSGELGGWMSNTSLFFIDFCAMLGLAYDLKTASKTMIKSRVMRTGDGSHAYWGWGDADQPEHIKNAAIIIGKNTDY